MSFTAQDFQRDGRGNQPSGRDQVRRLDDNGFPHYVPLELPPHRVRGTVRD